MLHYVTWLFKKTKFGILIPSAVKLLLANKISLICIECRKMEQSSSVLAQFLELLDLESLVTEVKKD